MLDEIDKTDIEVEVKIQVNKPVTDHKKKYAHIGKMRASLIRLAKIKKCDYIMFLDDDMTFAPNTFKKLYRHKAPFASGIAFMKTPPYNPTCLRCVPTRKDGIYHEQYDPILDYKSKPFKVDGIGMFCCLIDMKVFKEIQKPWFTMKDIMPESNLGEDVALCRRLWERGLDIICDPCVKCGHIRQDDGREITEKDFLRLRKIRLRLKR